ncbi:metallophosphoesterase family protein [Hyphococcus sp.]|uniref:metallophosphoesterase family protein n=1 Tax=Hyphococcus sp. TaxID=2038636 RepID=UPI0035C730EC
MQYWRVIGALGLMALMAACASSPEQGASFAFPVIGDIPYSDSDRKVLHEEIVPAIKAGGYPFVIHIGDYKGGGAPCTPEEDEAQLALIETLAPIPVFYTPGDNEWTDCDRHKDAATGRPASELARLVRLETLFFTEPVGAPEEIYVRSMPNAPGNATWDYKGVRFAMVHVVGTGNGRREVMGDDPAEAARLADKRERDALNWLTVAAAAARTENATALVIAMHADMTDVKAENLGVACEGAAAGRQETCDAFVALRAAIRRAANSFGGPTLLIHGDTAPFTLRQSFAGDEANNLWILNAAGDYGVNSQDIPYGVQDATFVSVDPLAAAPFSAKGIATARPAND